MLVKTVTTVVATNSIGQPVDAIPVRQAAAGETDIIGRPVDVITVEESEFGVPVRYVTGKAAQNSAGQWVDTIAVQGGGVVPINPGTPDGPEEAVITPAVMTQRSTYSTSKVGVIASRPAQMLAGNGAYYFDQAKWPSAAYPDRILALYSSDHDAEGTNGSSGNGGIYAIACVGDPKVAANWKSYEDASAAGWFDDVPGRPASNPIYLGAGAGTGLQCETPCFGKVGNKWVMTYQLEKNVVGARNQATLRAVGDNPLVWTGSNVPLMQVPITEAIGDGHHGYAKWGSNPFPRDLVPYNYIMYSLIGGQQRSTQAMWGWDDPENGTPVFISALNKQGGRASPSNPFSVATNWMESLPITIDVKSIRQTRQGYSAISEFAVQGAGASARPGSIFELPLSPNGLEVIGKPIQIIANGPEVFDVGETSTPALLTFGNARVIGYIGATAGNEKTVDLATSPLRNPANTWFRSFSPPIAPDYTETVYDLRGGSLPAGVELVTAGTASASYDADGVTLSVGADGEAYLFVNDPRVMNGEDYHEVYAKGLRTTSVAANRIPYVGLASAKVVRASMTDALFLSNGEGTSALLFYTALVAGAQPVASFSSDYYYGVGYGASANNGQAGSKKNVGLRVFPQVGRAYALGEGHVEMEDLRRSTGNLMTALDKTKAYYPFVGVKGVSGTTTERITHIVVRRRTAAKQAGDATLGTVARFESASNASSYTAPSLDLGAEAANRKVAFIVTTRSAGDITAIAATLTPAGGAAIPLTAQRFFKTNYGSGAAYTATALFVADVPTGATGSLAVSITAGSAPARCAVDSFAMYGVSSTVKSANFASLTGNSATLVSEVDKGAGGIAIACVAHSTTSSSLHTSAAEETRFAVASEEITAEVAGAGTVQMLGVKNLGAPATVETPSGSWSGASLLVASFDKAA